MYKRQSKNWGKPFPVTENGFLTEVLSAAKKEQPFAKSNLSVLLETGIDNTEDTRPGVNLPIGWDCSDELDDYFTPDDISGDTLELLRIFGECFGASSLVDEAGIVLPEKKSVNGVETVNKVTPESIKFDEEDQLEKFKQQAISFGASTDNKSRLIYIGVGDGSNESWNSYLVSVFDKYSLDEGMGIVLVKGDGTLLETNRRVSSRATLDVIRMRRSVKL